MTLPWYMGTATVTRQRAGLHLLTLAYFGSAHLFMVIARFLAWRLWAIDYNTHSVEAWYTNGTNGDTYLQQDTSRSTVPISFRSQNRAYCLSCNAPHYVLRSKMVSIVQPQRGDDAKA